ncbi:hypothetical protein [Streptomyces sp. WG5]|uniref:hypothetical protein n=1 Tax=Streptomyces sp. WG5 TaxID=3417648 RepID=UPI003CF21B50
MNYLEDAERRASYWHQQYREANQRANSAVAEAKKSKERELTAIRMMLEYKKELNQLRKFVPSFPLFKENP